MGAKAPILLDVRTSISFLEGKLKPQTAELKPQSLEVKPKTWELKPRAEAQERRAEAISYSIRSSFSGRLRNMFIIIINRLLSIEWQNDWVCNYKTMKSMKL